MVKYELRVHVRDVIYGLDIGNHTGYDLITIHEDGTTTIQYIDLYTNSTLDIGFYISEPISAQEYTIIDEEGTSRTILWGTQTIHDATIQNTTVEYLTENKVYTSVIIGETDSAEALKIFNKIKLEAIILNQLKDYLTYHILERNCNTSTNYFAEQYLNGQDVFARLPLGIYMGYSESFYDPYSTSTTDVTIAKVREILDKYYSLVGTDVDLSNVDYEVVNQSDAWYVKFSTEEYNYIFTGNGTPNIVDLSGNSIIYAMSGNNIIDAGTGADIVYGRESNIISAGDGNDLIYAGDKTYSAHTIGGGSGDDYIYAGLGGDYVQGNSGNNTVYLSQGSDKYTGGDNVDIVDGGSLNLIIKDNIDKTFNYEILKDLKGDINTIHLNGGDDTYIGGDGKDIVYSGSGNDIISTGDGNDEVYTNDSDNSNDVNTIDLGDGDDVFVGGAGNDTVNGEGGDDTIKAGDGNNVIVGGEGNDRIESGTGNDDIKGGTGSDTIIDRGGNNSVNLGDDNNQDYVSLSGTGTQTISNMTNQDTITCVGGFDLDSVIREGRDVIIRGNNGAEFILKNVADDEDDEIPEENMPLLYHPDGTVYKWQDGDYVDSGIDYPSYEDYPETIPSISEGETLPSEPNDGDSKTQKDKEPSISEDKKDDVEGLINGAENTRSPLLLDLDGDGIETISTDAGVYFDHDNNQKYENTGWIGKDDAFLVRDINGNSEIDNGTEMFGNHTIKADGTTAYNGFDALKDLDSNKDGKFDANDEAWDEVKLWRDKNTNGTVEAGELYTLAELGIKHINLSYNYQTEADENNNIEIQQGTYTKTDGTTGKISDVWFDVNGINTKFEETVEIPENIKQLPNIAGFGNVTSLHTAMAMDTTGTLKSLVEQYLVATDEAQKSTLLDNIIYHWTGVQNLPINGRDPTQVYGKVIDDTRKLEALEEFLGKEYLGTWCWGERDPNPHGQAAPMILQAYEMLKNYIGTILSADIKNNAYLQAITLTYNAQTKHWDVDVSQAVALLQADYEENLQQGRKTIIDLSAILEYFDNAQDVYSAFQSYGVIDGTELEQDLLRFGNFSTGSTGSDTLNGSDDELVRLDEDNNCKIYTILNCKKINSKIEDLTCSDSELIKLYNEMQEKYFKLCKSLPNKNEQMKLYKDQTKWLNEQEMADYMSFGAYNRRIFYLKKAYQEKLNDLENYNK